MDNKTTQTVDTSTVTMRYWYQDEGLGTSLVFESAYVSIGHTNQGKVTGKVVTASPSGPGADHYFELSFTGTMAAKGDAQTGDQFNINLLLHPSSYQGTVDVTNDYSYNAGATGYDDKITLHDRTGKVIWGTAPGTGAAVTTPDAATDANASNDQSGG
jgi:hypothetical protein